MRILDWKHEEEGFFHKLWEALVEGGKDILENSETKEQAIRIPLHGELKHADADVWTTIVYLLRNAFIEALQRGFDEKLAQKMP